MPSDLPQRKARRFLNEHLQSQAIAFALLFAFEPAVYASSGYKLMPNLMRHLDRDGTWKTLVHRGGNEQDPDPAGGHGRRASGTPRGPPACSRPWT